MRLASLAVVLLLSVSLAGCSFGGEKESVDVNKDAYRGGEGVAVVVTNEAEDPFNVTFRVLGVGNVELGRFDERLEPGDSIERWYSVDGSGIYSARMSYVWSARTGSTAYGEDDKTFRTDECAMVTRLEWSLLVKDDTAGSQFQGQRCIDKDGEDFEPPTAPANGTENS